jgi:hypothetical protein
MDQTRPDLRPYIQPHLSRSALTAPRHRFGVAVALAVGFLLAYAIAHQSPNTVIIQRFEAPVNAPVINSVRTDQQAEVNAEVQP